MLKIGLLGCGFMGSMHAACYKVLGCPVAAVADLRPEKSAEMGQKYGCAVYESAEKLIAEADLDIIDICLPTFLHTRYAVQAMERGRSVFIEKPVCLNREEAAQLLDAQRRSGAQVMVGQVIRLWDEYVWLKQAMDEGRYGKALSANFQRVSPLPTWGWQDWLNDPSRSGTVALDMHIHDADYIRYAFGEPAGVKTRVSRDPAGKIIHIVSAYDYGPLQVFAEGCWDYPTTYPFAMSFRVMFEKAMVALEGGKLKVYTNAGVETPDARQAPAVAVEGGGNISDLGAYLSELKYFTQRLSAGQSIEISTLEDALRSYELVMREIDQAGGFVKKD